MPGILPMKVIKIGTNAQTRIAQACDRCRSKKIRCDGIRPCCTQCANVGFECKTSDKLSRRAFPRGYTESLEERVRLLEAEVRELKELLDEKDEKIDMLSRIHSHSPKSFLHTSPRRQSDSSVEEPDEHAISDEEDECFKVKRPAFVLGEGEDTYLAGPSSTYAFLEAFKLSVGKENSIVRGLDPANLFPQPSTSTAWSPQELTAYNAPSRLLSDQLINIFFQEWAPLFPVLHRPTLLSIYGRYVTDPDSVSDAHELACLHLIFAIAAACRPDNTEELASFDAQWSQAISAIGDETTLECLQATTLAKIRCLQAHDLGRLREYKDRAATLCLQLDLHRCQDVFEADTLYSETKKKLFWTSYTVDCFASAVLGLPTQHVQDGDILCDYPIDADDEYLSSNGIQPCLPGEETKLSSALALFKAARILSRVLTQVYPVEDSYELSLKHLSDLSDELELWEASLPAHLRLPFAQDKPSTGTITSRSPILSFVYHYIRALIYRPAICATSLGNKASSAMLAHAGSCKRMIQVLELLKERGLTFSTCLSKDEVLITCSIGSLLQRLRLGPTSKMLKDNRHTTELIYAELAHSNNDIASNLLPIIKSVIPDFAAKVVSEPARMSASKCKPSIARNDSDYNALPEQTNHLPSATRRQLKAIASRFSATTNGKVPSLTAENSTSSTSDTLTLHPPSRHAQHTPSLTPNPRPSSSAASRSDASLSPTFTHTRSGSNVSRSVKPAKRQTMPARTNLDYLSFGNEPGQENLPSLSIESLPIKTEPQPSDWEKLLGDLDNGSTNIFDASYGGRPIEALTEVSPLQHPAARTAMSDAALAWNAGLLTLQESTSKQSAVSRASRAGRASNSVWSASSDEGRGSLDDPSATDWTSASSTHDTNETYVKLDLTDVNVPFDFEAELGAEWPSDLVNVEA